MNKMRIDRHPKVLPAFSSLNAENMVRFLEINQGLLGGKKGVALMFSRDPKPNEKSIYLWICFTEKDKLSTFIDGLTKASHNVFGRTEDYIQ